MVNDFKSWVKENEELINFLKENDSLIMARYNDIMMVLSYLSKKEENLDADLSVIYDFGFSYIYDRFDYIKEFIKTYFDGDRVEFLKYEQLINYYIYLEDLHDVIEEREMDVALYQKRLDAIAKEIIEVIKERIEFNDQLVDKFNMMLDSAFPSKADLSTTPEVFSQILDELIIEENKTGHKFRP